MSHPPGSVRGHLLLYSETVAHGRESGRWIGPKWVRGVGSRVERATEALLPEDHEARLEWDKKSLVDLSRLYGPDGGLQRRARPTSRSNWKRWGDLLTRGCCRWRSSLHFGST
jgi:hypothetical protein